MQKVIVVSYDINPNWGSEAGKAHNWLLAMAEHYDIEVFVHNKHRQDIETYPYPANIRFIFAMADSKMEANLAEQRRFDKVNNLFLEAIEKEFIERIESKGYKFVLFLSPSGIHSYNTLYKKREFTYAVGPLGGGIRTPKGFGKLFSLKDMVIDFFRNRFYSKLKSNSDYIGYLENASRIIIGTDYLYEYLPSTARSNAVVYFDTLVDMAEFPIEEQPEPDMTCDGQIRLLYTGRLCPQKGIRMLVEAMNNIRIQHPRIANKLRLNVFGDGTERTRMQALVSKYGLEKDVFLHGDVPRAQILKELKKADIYCFPTIREPGGQSILEAMAAGLPIITSDYGGPKFSVSDDCGIKIPVDNFDNYVRNLADAIIRLAEDEPLRRKMGEAARKRVSEDYSLEALKKRIPEIYGGVKNE